MKCISSRVFRTSTALGAGVFAAMLGLQIACSKSSAADSPVNVTDPAGDSGGPAPAPAAAVVIGIGTLGHGGTSCVMPAPGTELSVTDTEITVNLENKLEKLTASSLARGTCTWALPLQVPAGQKMVVDKIWAQSEHDLSAGGSVEGSAEVFMAGSTGQFIEISDKSRTVAKHSRATHEVDAKLESACGAGLNLRANTAIILRDGADISQSRISGLTIGYHLEACP